MRFQKIDTEVRILLDSADVVIGVLGVVHKENDWLTLLELAFERGKKAKTAELRQLLGILP